MNELRWSDLSVGMSAHFDAAITEEMLDTFAALSGDVNPLHMDAAFAKAGGFRDRVAFGMLSSAFYSTLVGVHLPGKWALLHGVDVEFKAPVYAGDRLRVSGEITFLNEAYRRIELKARMTNHSGQTVSKATIQVGLRES